MPNPKTGTVTTDVGKAVTEFKGGRVEYRTERQGANVHVPIGKVSFDADALLGNFRAVVDELQRAKPAAAKGRYMRKIVVSSGVFSSIAKPQKRRNESRSKSASSSPGSDSPYQRCRSSTLNITRGG